MQTRRLVLRTLTRPTPPSDISGGCMTRRRAVPRIAAGEHSLESLRRYIETCNAGPRTAPGICLRDGAHIGNIKLGPIDPYHQRCCGRTAHRRAGRVWQRLCVRGIDAVTTHAFETLGLEKLYAGCYASNTGSVRAFLKAGWTEEGRGKADWRLDDGREDNIALGITRPTGRPIGHEDRPRHRPVRSRLRDLEPLGPGRRSRGPRRSSPSRNGQASGSSIRPPPTANAEERLGGALDARPSVLDRHQAASAARGAEASAT